MLTPLFNNGRDNYSGEVNAPIELVQYGDYQCTHCADAYPVIKSLQNAMGDSMRFVFRNFPLPNIHSLALDSAVAAEAAGMQGKFWQMHDLILENQKHLTHSSFSWFAEEIHLNINKFERDRQSNQIFQKVTSDFEGGIRSGVNGTPTFFINSLRYNGFTDFKGLYNACFFMHEYSSNAS